jgi:hypothetical protein
MSPAACTRLSSVTGGFSVLSDGDPNPLSCPAMWVGVAVVVAAAQNAGVPGAWFRPRSSSLPSTRCGR